MKLEIQVDPSAHDTSDHLLRNSLIRIDKCMPIGYYCSFAHAGILISLQPRLTRSLLDSLCKVTRQTLLEQTLYETMMNAITLTESNANIPRNFSLLVQCFVLRRL
jgi:hypothetical protein